MIAPTPLLKPSPMDVSALFSGTWTLFKKKLGLYLLIMLAPIAVIFVAVALYVVLLVGLLGGLAAGATPGSGAIAAMIVGYFVVIVVAFLALYKAEAMVIYAAYEAAQDRNPTFSSTLSGTKGFLPRFMVLFALGALLVVVVGGLLGLLMIGAASGSAGSNDSSSVLAMTGVIMMVIFLSIPVSYYFAVKLLYVLPEMAIEQTDGISAIKRSWKLTNGAFWRTLGYVLLVAIVIGTIASVVGVVSQIAMIPWARSLETVQYSNDPAEVLGALLTGLPLLIIPTILSTIIQMVSIPFMLVYITVMYVDQVRRSELPAGFTGGPGPAYGAGYPQQSYGGAQPGYPPPPPNPPQPGTGYPPPPPEQPQ